MRAGLSGSKAAIAFVFALCVAGVQAAEESPIPGLSVCAFTCTADAAIAKGCKSYLNVECVCHSQEFQVRLVRQVYLHDVDEWLRLRVRVPPQLAAGECLLSKCTEVELKTAMVYQAAVCT